MSVRMINKFFLLFEIVFLKTAVDVHIFLSGLSVAMNFLLANSYRFNGED